jgi:hypothetical protein
LAFVLLLLLGAASWAREEKPLVIVVPPEVTGVVYKVEELREILSAHVGERLRARGYNVLGATTLTAADRDCRAQACLEGIPARYNVDLVIAPRLESDEKTHNYRIGIKLFQNGLGYKSRERLCVGCSDFNARDMLGDTIVEMLGGTVVEAPPPSPAPLATPPPVANDRGRWVYRGPAIALFVVGALGLAQGFAEVAHDGDRGCEDGRCFTLDTTKGQALFLSLGAASLVAGAVLAYFGWRPMRNVAVSASGVGVKF